MIRVFIGFDDNEEVAFHTLSQSIHEYASHPVSITPIRLSQLRAVFYREPDPLQSTQFSFSRFLTPYLSDYKGWSIFMDCDMLFTEDIYNLWRLRDKRYALQVVQHQHIPKEGVKFLNQVQTKYFRKNWSSLMLFNNAKCRALTPEYVNTATGLELHQFKWLDDDAIGSLPQKWNHLVGYNAPQDDIGNIHFTNGGPYFKDYEQSDYHQLWRDSLKKVLYAKNSADFLRESVANIQEDSFYYPQYQKRNFQ